MSNSEVLDASVAVKESMQLGAVNKDEGGVFDDLGFNEKFLDDLDSYWDDLNARLTVSRMVSNSVVKGIVSAVVEEAAEKIILKEAEVAFLNERLWFYESRVEGEETLDANASAQVNGIRNLSELRIEAEMLIRRLKEELGRVRGVDSTSQSEGTGRFEGMYGYVDALEVVLAAMFARVDGNFFPLKPLIAEQQRADEFTNEINTIVLSLRDELKRLHERRTMMDTLNEKWEKIVVELSKMRQELDTISRSLFNPESVLIFSQSSIESLEEWNNAKRKDQVARNIMGNHQAPCFSRSDDKCNPSSQKSNEFAKPMLDIADSPLLKCMTKEELIAYHKTETTKMKRQHESAVQEMTEELFSLKRELLNEKGFNPSHSRKDKEFELLRKKIPEFIAKLDDMLLENEKLHIVCDDQNLLDTFEERMSTLCLRKNQWQQDATSTQVTEAVCLDSRFPYEARKMLYQSPIEANLLKQIRKLESDIEDMSTRANVADEVLKVALRELIDGLERGLEDIEMENKIMQEIYSTILVEAVHGALSSKYPAVAMWDEEKATIVAALLKETSLSSEVEANQKLKHEIASLKTLMKEKDDFASETTSKLMEQSEHLNLAHQELHTVRDQVAKQEKLISESKINYNLLRTKLDETLWQISNYEVEIYKLNQSSKTLRDALTEAEKQKNALRVIIQEKEEALTLAINKEKEQREHMKSIMISMSGLSKMISDCECRLKNTIEKNESRVNMLNQQCSQLVQVANLHKKEAFHSKQKYEIKSCDLQKAEIEVDLLGNEVDALMCILEMIYIALDHYSYVLQYYPGVMDILELLGKELKKRYQ